VGAELSLSMAGGRRFAGVARLIVGGLAARLDLPYEQMDDLQLAAESVLAVERSVDDEVVLELELGDDALQMRIAPFDARSFRPADTDGEGALSLERLLTALVDTVRVESRDGVEWLILEKRVPLPTAAE
jgi:anti-sigma regulatory factor (Ser/Thr protein kinase)